MRNCIDIDYIHSRAIVREVGERLRGSLKPEPELPARLKMQFDRLRELEEQSPSIVSGAKRWDRTRLDPTWTVKMAWPSMDEQCPR